MTNPMTPAASGTTGAGPGNGNGNGSGSGSNNGDDFTTARRMEDLRAVLDELAALERATPTGDPATWPAGAAWASLGEIPGAPPEVAPPHPAPANAPIAPAHAPANPPAAHGRDERRPGARAKFDDTAPAFPVDALSRPLADLVREGAAAFNLPPDFIAVPLLPLAAAAIGNRVRLEIKPGWTEYPIIWAVMIGEPGTGKSAGLTLARHPLAAVQRAAMHRYAEERAAWEQGGEHGAEPAPDILSTTDATLEAIVSLHRRSRGLVVIRDEVAGWATSMDAYRKGGDRQTWLTLWSGGEVRVDRKTSEPVTIAEPAISVCGGVQPDRLAMLLGERGVQDGFADRFLLSRPDVGPPRWSMEQIAPWTIDEAAKLFAALRPADAPVVTCRFSPEALRRWAAWYDMNGARQAAAAGFERGWLAKGPRHLARLILILHATDQPRAEDLPIAPQTVERAILLHDYFHGHVQALTPEIEPGLEGLEMRIWTALDAAGPIGLSKTELRRGAGSHLATSRIDRALARLEELQLAEARRGASGALGGRPAARWRAIRPTP